MLNRHLLSNHVLKKFKLISRFSRHIERKLRCRHIVVVRGNGVNDQRRHRNCCFRQWIMLECQGGRKPSSAAAPLLRRKRCQYEEGATTALCSKLIVLWYMFTVWVFQSSSSILDSKSFICCSFSFFKNRGENFHSNISYSLVFRKVLVRSFGSFFRANPKFSVFCQPVECIHSIPYMGPYYAGFFNAGFKLCGI